MHLFHIFFSTTFGQPPETVDTGEQRDEIIKGGRNEARPDRPTQNGESSGRSRGTPALCPPITHSEYRV